MVRYADDSIFCFQYKEDDDGDENSFDFLGFTHCVGKDKNERKRIMRKTSKNKYKASLLRCKEWMKENRILPIF